MESSSQLDPLGTQSLVDARSDSHMAESCNKQLGQTASARVRCV